ncbi:hypothetical protein GQX74_001246 [Glossina fuscipes]|nr:hypothetical protein GQX74_001246 [Glossina fuscipes]
MSAPVPIKTEEVILENVEYNSAEELDEELHYFVAIETAVPANVVTIAINLTTGKSYSPSYAVVTFSLECIFVFSNASDHSLFLILYGIQQISITQIRQRNPPVAETFKIPKFKQKLKLDISGLCLIHYNENNIHRQIFFITNN